MSTAIDATTPRDLVAGRQPSVVRLGDSRQRSLQHQAREAMGDFLSRPTGVALDELRAILDRLLAHERDCLGASEVETDDGLALRRSQDRLATALGDLIRARPGTDHRISRGHTLRHRLIAHVELTTAVARRPPTPRMEDGLAGADRLGDER